MPIYDNSLFIKKVIHVFDFSVDTLSMGIISIYSIQLANPFPLMNAPFLYHWLNSECEMDMK